MESGIIQIDADGSNVDERFMPCMSGLETVRAARVKPDDTIKFE